MSYCRRSATIICLCAWRLRAELAKTREREISGNVDGLRVRLFDLRAPIAEARSPEVTGFREDASYLSIVRANACALLCGVDMR